mmetsp:Transcript_106221/g.333095  ORF Transcript_106221/g.333095 Transcript_106221/m.333095 type:complete len:430 (-) Transcript_106221:149-1438(-)
MRSPAVPFQEFAVVVAKIELEGQGERWVTQSCGPEPTFGPRTEQDVPKVLKYALHGLVIPRPCALPRLPAEVHAEGHEASPRQQLVVAAAAHRPPGPGPEPLRPAPRGLPRHRQLAKVVAAVVVLPQLQRLAKEQLPGKLQPLAVGARGIPARPPNQVRAAAERAPVAAPAPGARGLCPAGPLGAVGPDLGGHPPRGVHGMVVPMAQRKEARLKRPLPQRCRPEDGRQRVLLHMLPDVRMKEEQHVWKAVVVDCHVPHDDRDHTRGYLLVERHDNRLPEAPGQLCQDPRGWAPGQVLGRQGGGGRTFGPGPEFLVQLHLQHHLGAAQAEERLAVSVLEAEEGLARGVLVEDGDERDPEEQHDRAAEEEGENGAQEGHYVKPFGLLFRLALSSLLLLGAPVSTARLSTSRPQSGPCQRCSSGRPKRAARC